MRLSDFDYSLPKEFIAQYPSEKHGKDRLLIVDRKKKSFEEKEFKEIIDYFKAGDLLVLNNTKVIPARLFGKRITGGKVEIFIVNKEKTPAVALVRPSGKIKEGERIALDAKFEATILGRESIGRLVEFNHPLDEVLKKCGHVPLPPYISRADEPSDRVRYQTVYAKVDGATASPTAGLHFTEELIRKLEEKGVKIAFITLHVSYGTFAPIKEDDISKHKMHSEFYCITKENISLIKDAKKNKAKIFSCGTTSLRTLEACCRDFGKAGEPNSLEGTTNLFVYPGYKFRIVDSLLTNFHLPKSTLLLLTSAFAGKDLLFKAYKYAVEKKYKFFSYGDAMLIT